ncbi:hypothetical protein A2456_00320 [Candidatus Nomurabacteria bacterium RIFOXYC2_FULL_36_19]|uniref:S-adenosylmethionine synthetase n=1 Tax=Candidatus Nomurabacteria bacterium RIFOXYC2_FULL_36_19 TaxID=1801806 RepID=A0A1F6YRX1_9BACT|nr:MAG: hypothetical protein A2456_00320 [Candidatus Nomurabacteria bacterium RIFOXYC2_FULL_36_19]OGJ14611.1 MAG: hypothetical protein A2554_01940 [Candidatus Nomurabacteria bacterium RIFOXYD2_FULL_35_12]
MALRFLTVIQDFLDPATLPVEIVERKGVGHPDSLADALANEVSVVFSRYCLARFGFVLHHNVDKLYIGAGNFRTDFGSCERLQPIQVLTNGRISSRFGDEKIDIVSLQKEAIEQYLFRVLPSLGKEDIVVVPNATQFHRNEHRFTPRNQSDVPDALSPRANDTSLCVSHWPPTITESLAYRFERYFWNAEEGFAVPRFANIGQDIKVFVLREGKHIEVLLSVPTLCRHTKSFKQYLELIRHHEFQLTLLGKEMVSCHGLSISVRVNPQKNPYMLGIGSCVECGEEGLVGRGNTILGIIASERTHTQESWAGKNPVYHTGRVLGYLTFKLARAISTQLQVKCSVSALTRCGGSLIPPRFLSVSVSDAVDRNTLESIVESEFLVANYVEEILAFRPWLTEL